MRPPYPVTLGVAVALLAGAAPAFGQAPIAEPMNKIVEWTADLPGGLSYRIGPLTIRVEAKRGADKLDPAEPILTIVDRAGVRMQMRSEAGLSFAPANFGV